MQEDIQIWVCTTYMQKMWMCLVQGQSNIWQFANRIFRDNYRKEEVSFWV